MVGISDRPGTFGRKRSFASGRDCRPGGEAVGIRAYLARLVREGQVERLPDGRYTLAVSARDAGAEPAGPVSAAFAPPRGFSPAKAPHTAWQRPVYWARAVWGFAFRAVLGQELAEEVGEEVCEELFARAMLFRLKLPPENYVLTPEQALVLQSYALRQAVEVRRRFRPPRRILLLHLFS